MSINKSSLYFHFPGYCYCYGYYYQTPNTFGYSSKKKWRATRLPVDLAAFKKERNRVMNLMNEVRLVYYNPFFEDNSTERRRLFAASKSLMNMKKDRSLPPYSDVSLLANNMGHFLLPRLPISGQSWTAFFHHILCCQRLSPAWNLNLVILYFPTSNAKRLRQFVM